MKSIISFVIFIVLLIGVWKGFFQFRPYERNQGNMADRLLHPERRYLTSTERPHKLDKTASASSPAVYFYGTPSKLQKFLIELNAKNFGKTDYRAWSIPYREIPKSEERNVVYITPKEQHELRGYYVYLGLNSPLSPQALTSLQSLAAQFNLEIFTVPTS